MTIVEAPIAEEVLHRCVVKEDGSFTIYTYDAYWQMPNMLPITNENSPRIKFCPYCGKRLGEHSLASQTAQAIINNALKSMIIHRTGSTDQDYIDMIRDMINALGQNIQITVIKQKETSVF